MRLRLCLKNTGVILKFQKHSIPVFRGPATHSWKRTKKENINYLSTTHNRPYRPPRDKKKIRPLQRPGARARTGFQNTGRFCLSRNNKRARIWVMEAISFLNFEYNGEDWSRNLQLYGFKPLPNKLNTRVTHLVCFFSFFPQRKYERLTFRR